VFLFNGQERPTRIESDMPLFRWVFALADSSGRTGGSDAALATVTSLPNLDERALVSEAQAGNRTAFEELVHRYDRDVLRLALNLMKRPKMRATFIRKLSSRFTAICIASASNAAFYTWLYRIVTNVCLDHLRRRQARPEDQAPEIHSNRMEEGPRDFF